MGKDAALWLLLVIASLVLCVSAVQGTTGRVLAAALAPALLVRSKQQG